MKNAVMAFLLSIGLMLGSMSVVHAEDTLQSKIDATEKGGVLVLDSDYTDEVTITKDITIDFAGHSLTTTNHGIVVDEGATVVIKGNGTISVTKGAVVNKNGNVTIENGTFISENWYVVKNFSNMTINGGKFTQGNNTSNSSLITNGWYNGAGSSSNDLGVTPPTDKATAILTINGGNFVHNVTSTSTIKSDDWSKTTINDGTFTSNNGFLVQATGTVAVKGGTFTGFGSIATIYGFDNTEFEPGLLNISGGTFNAKYLYRADNLGKVTVTNGIFNLSSGLIESDNSKVTLGISGGTYTIAVDEKYITDGYLLNQSGDSYVVNPNLTIETEDENVSFESDTPISNDYKLVVEEAKVEDEEALTESISDKITESLKDTETLQSTKLLATYDISVKDSNDNIVKMENGNYAISIKLTTEQLGEYNAFKVVYINDNGEVAEVLDAVLKEGVLTFETTHLSTYAVVGYNTLTVDAGEDEGNLGDSTTTDTPSIPETPSEEIPEVPQTFDSLVSYVGVSVISVVAIACTLLYIKKKQTN